MENYYICSAGREKLRTSLWENRPYGLEQVSCLTELCERASSPGSRGKAENILELHHFVLIPVSSFHAQRRWASRGEQHRPTSLGVD